MTKITVSVAGDKTITSATLATAARVLDNGVKHGIPEGVNAALVFNVEGEKVKIYQTKGGDISVAFTGVQVEKPKNLPLDLEDGADAE